MFVPGEPESGKSAMLTTDQIESYRQNGYVTIPGMFDGETIGKLRRVTDEFVQRSAQVSENNDVFDLEPGHTSSDPRLRRLKRPEQQHPAYDRIFRDDRILDMVEQLVGPNVQEFGGKLNMKCAAYGSPVEWHQDFAFGPRRSNDDILAVGVAIDPMTPENGCLLVVPGSHRGRIYDHFTADGVFAGAVTEPEFDPGDVAPVQLDAGDISIHHGRLLHASAPNTTPDRPRRFYLLQYSAADSWVEGADEEQIEVYRAQMIRGQLPPEPRYADFPPVPRPAVVRQGRGGSIYEQQTHLGRGFSRLSGHS